MLRIPSTSLEGGGMVNVIGQLLPLMVAVALSSVPIMVTVTILLTPKSRRTAFAFLIGWLLGLLLVSGILTLVLQSIPSASRRRAQPTVGITEIVIGCLLIGYGLFLLVRSRGREVNTRTELPKWLRAVGTMKPVPSAGLALLLNVRPKSLLLSATAALILGTSGLPVPETVVVLLIFVVVGGSTVSVPIVLTLVNPDMMRRPLQSTERWLLRNSRTVTLVVALIIGTVVLGDGMTRL
jgi:Sap, sulfolipid-1-addressing protein